MTAILSLSEIRKSFGGVKALGGVSLEIAAGEVHAIVGENGAGKSTLMNILAGVYVPDGGTMRFKGAVYAPQNPQEARLRGISIVFQELALFPTLTVQANLFAGKEKVRGIRLDHAAMLSQTRAALTSMAVDLHPNAVVGDLTLGQRQWVEIARALTDEAQVIILDEPNSALSHHETQVLFGLIQRLKARGVTLIYISHRLEEVFQIADRITVLRDGHYIHTWRTPETTVSEIVAAMIGRRADEEPIRKSSASAVVVLDVDRLSVRGKLEAISLRVHAGEVVGVVGLAGAGVTPLFEAVFGVQQPTSGQVRVDGKPLHAVSPRDAMRRGLGMVPSDRRGLGLMMNWSVGNNITLAVLARLSRWGIIRRAESERLADDYIERLKIVTRDLHQEILYLSGGNQQKALLARWLATQPRLMILEDPTRGIDVGAKQEIYHLIDQIARDGVGVLLTSSEIEEVLALSDRIVVLRNRRLAAVIPRDAADKRLLLEFSAGDLTHARALLNTRVSAGSVTLPLPERADDTSQPAQLPAPQSRSSAIRLLLKLLTLREFGVIQALIAVLVLFSLLSPFFFTASNLLLISRQMAILGVIATGMTFVIAAGEIDLSVGWNFNMVMSAMALLMLHGGIDAWLTIPIGIGLGAVLGAFNGIFAVLFQLPTIIVTLGTLTLYRGLALSLNGGRTVSGLPESSFFQIGSGGIGGVPLMSVVMLMVFVAAAWLLGNMRVARHWLAMGANRLAAERVGIRTARRRIAVMTFNGLLCGVAGVLGLAFLGAADPQSGSGYELTAIAAAIIGGAKLGGGSGTIWGTLVGIALIMAIQNGLALIGLPPAWQIASTGVVIIAAVTVDYLTRSRRQSLSETILKA